eukprot:GDKJ01058362.1.p1 GENE.GDKJ01058362.1~~GDKJ01058362.1.p1  ORF type:complete len:222 (+),score=1.81 GDKJ01058362.1:100-765(+)
MPSHSPAQQQSSEVDFAALSYFAGLAPTESNAELMSNLCHLGRSTDRAHSTRSRYSTTTALTDGDEAEDLLAEAMHLSMGLPPGTHITDSVLRHNGHPRTQISSGKETSEDRSRSVASSAEDSIQALHLAMGLMPTTSMTRSILGIEGDDESERMGTIAGPSRYMTPRAMSEAATSLAKRFFPSTFGAQRDRDSPEAKEARLRRAKKAQVQSGIPEELLGF